jgi:hypothetical protein
MAAWPCLKTSGLGRKTGDINTRLNMEAAFQSDVQAHMCEGATDRLELRRISENRYELMLSTPSRAGPFSIFCIGKRFFVQSYIQS